MKNLRTLQNSQVQRYHKENYTPDNTLFVLSGNVDPKEFFKALDQVEQNIKSKQEVVRIANRPWTDPVPQMDLTATGVMPPAKDGNDSDIKPHTIKFPSEDESRGTISIGWRGPTYDQRQTWVNLLLLWE